MQDFLKSSTSSLAALMLQAYASASAMKSLNGHSVGPGRKTHKRLTNGTPSSTKLRVTRQQERAEARADGKQFDSRMKRRMRDEAGKALSQRASERELRELERRDNRMDVHTMIEKSRGAGRLARGAFA